MTTSNYFEGSKAEMIGMIPVKIWEKDAKFSGHMFVENWFRPSLSVVARTRSSTIVSPNEGDMSVRGYLQYYTVIETACVDAGDFQTCYSSSYTACSGGCGGDGGDGEVLVPVSPDLPASQLIYMTNQVTDPCVSKVIELTLNNNIDDEIKTMLYFFGGTPRYNIVFKNVNNIANCADANTTGNLLADGSFRATITFSDANLVNASKEYITVLIIHEVVHAYLKTKPNGQNDLQ